MKILQINVTGSAGSTGKICASVSRLLTERQIENYILHIQPHCDAPGGIQYAGVAYRKLNAFLTFLMGNFGFTSRLATLRLIRHLERIKPDIVHLHNIHSYNVHLGRLLSYIKKKKIKLFWTFHDCWAFTAYCPHFAMAKCEKWRTGCEHCPQRKHYSWFFDRSKTLYKRKKELMSGLDLTVITPSQWLKGMVEQSFLKNYPVHVIHNGVNLSAFTPTPSDFRTRYGCTDQKLVLGVAFGWTKGKGLDVFMELAKRLDPHRYRVVLVGTTAQMDKLLPDTVIPIPRVNDVRTLAEIYSAADVFVNPTREETLGLVNLEALACGIPGITFSSGGSPECFDDTCGSVVPCDDIDALEKEIIRICEKQPYTPQACIKRAQAFDENVKYVEYLKLYENSECQ